MEFAAERIGRIVKRIKKRENFSVRPFDMKRFSAEVESFKEIYNDAWHDNWGFVALTEAELDHMAKDLKPIVEAKLANFVEHEGRLVGFALVFPTSISFSRNSKRAACFPGESSGCSLDSKKFLTSACSPWESAETCKNAVLIPCSTMRVFGLPATWARIGVTGLGPGIKHGHGQHNRAFGRQET